MATIEFRHQKRRAGILVVSPPNHSFVEQILDNVSQNLKMGRGTLVWP
jgi:hypothetical protein